MRRVAAGSVSDTTQQRSVNKHHETNIELAGPGPAQPSPRKQTCVYATEMLYFEPPGIDLFRPSTAATSQPPPALTPYSWLPTEWPDDSLESSHARGQFGSMPFLQT